MAPTIIGNGTLVTCDEQRRVIDGGAIVIDDGVIAAVGDGAALRASFPHADWLDARGQFIMPGMICAHTHTYGAFARGMALKDPPPETFLQILERLWWRLDRALQPDDVRYSALVCLIDAIRHGVTTLIDHHASPNACTGSLDVLAEAFAEAGVRGCLSYEVSDREGREKAQQAIRENERFARRLRRAGRPGQAAPMLAAMMGLHSAFTLSDETIGQAASVARDLGIGCHLHVGESEDDLFHSRQARRSGPVERLAALGALGAQTIAAHCVHLDEQERRALAATGTMVVHNARSNMNNAVGAAPVEQMLACGLCVGLGNDGFSNDMFAEMKAAYLWHKAAQGNPQAMPADVVARLAIANNAHIAGVAFGGPAAQHRFGQLTVGSPADVVLVDYAAPTPVTADNLPWHMIFGMEGGMVTTTIVSGRVLMRERQVLSLDEPAIYARARHLAAALWERF